MASEPTAKMNSKEGQGAREDDEDEGQPRCYGWTCWSALMGAKANWMQVWRRIDQQARVDIARQTSTMIRVETTCRVVFSVVEEDMVPNRKRKTSSACVLWFVLGALQRERSQGGTQRPQDPLETENTRKANYSHVTTTNKCMLQSARH